MKVSTIIIWTFEILLISWLGFCLWFGKVSEWTFLVVALCIILAVWDNKRVKISKEGIEVDEEEK
jgi:cell division protein FtsB